MLFAEERAEEGGDRAIDCIGIISKTTVNLVDMAHLSHLIFEVLI